MPSFSRIAVAGFIVLLLAAAIFAAGCARNRGQDIPVPSPTAPAVTDTMKAKTTLSAVQTVSAAQGTASKTCSQLGGTETGAGQTCPGTYLPASDSFSCCSLKPTGGTAAGAILSIEPFTPPADDEVLPDITG